MDHSDSDLEELEHLAEVAGRVRTGRQRLSMTVYAIEHGRRTPEQVAAVLGRAACAIYRNRLVRQRWSLRLAVH